ncbi:hypothetical protein ACHAWF_017660 [Thalassiosira exigua]
MLPSACSVHDWIPHPDVGDVLHPARHLVARVLAQVVHVPVRQGAVERHRAPRTGRNLHPVVTIGRDGARERRGSPGQADLVLLRLAHDRVAVLVLGHHVSLSREVQEDRGVPARLIPASDGRVGKVVVRGVAVPGSVAQELHRLDDPQVRGGRHAPPLLLLLVLASEVVIPIAHEVLVDPQEVRDPPEDRVHDRVLLPVDPPRGRSARGVLPSPHAAALLLPRVAEGALRHGRGGHDDVASFARGQGDEVVHFRGGEEASRFEDARGDADHAEVEGRGCRVAVDLARRCRGGSARAILLLRGAGRAVRREVPHPPGLGLRSVILPGQPRQLLREGGEGKLLRGNLLRVVEVRRRPHAHCARSPSAVLCVRGRRRELREPDPSRAHEVIPPEGPVGDPRVPQEPLLGRPLLLADHPVGLLASLVVAQPLQGIVVQDRLVFRDRPPLQLVLLVVRGGEVKGVAGVAARPDRLERRDRPDLARAPLSPPSIDPVPPQDQRVGGQVDELEGVPRVADVGLGHLAVASVGVALVRGVEFEDGGTVVVLRGPAEGPARGLVEGVLMQEAEVLLVDQVFGEVLLDRGSDLVEHEALAALLLDQSVDVVQDGIGGVGPQFRTLVVGMRGVSLVSVGDVISVEDARRGGQGEDELHLLQAVAVRVVAFVASKHKTAVVEVSKHKSSNG